MDQPSTSSNINVPAVNGCSICSFETAEKLINVSTIKGKESLKNASIERGDKLFANIDLSKDIFVHASCRSDYIHKRSIQAAKRKNEQEKTKSISPVKRKLRKSLNSSSSDLSEGEVDFNWKENCLFCEKEANIEAEKKLNVSRRQVIRIVDSPDFQKHLIEKLIGLNDDYHRSILKRVQSEHRNLTVLQARYHKVCYMKIFNDNRPPLHAEDTYSYKIDLAMEDIYSFMLSSDECQFSMTQLIEAIQKSNVIPDERTIKGRLKQKFGDEIVFSSRLGGVTYVCYSSNLYDILTAAWRQKFNAKTIEETENRLIDSAAELIRRKIRKTICRTNEYPASDKILTDVNQNIPPLLLRFLNHVIYKDKQQTIENENKYSKKITSIAHAIMSAARLKSFISPLQLAAGTTFYRKFGSRKIIDICYQLGFSCSYNEVKLYEICAALQANRSLADPFLQIVSDNSDFNICTIDGRRTFHYLGSIEIITPSNSIQARLPIQRLSKSEIPNASELVEKHNINIELYTKKAGSGLKNIIVKELSKDPSFEQNIVDKLNILWMYFKYARSNNFVGWNGFMSFITSSRTNYAVSAINFLPFINGSPSDYSTLYTVLKYASEIISKEGMKTLIITFDQPLYIKARDIVAASNFHAVHIVVRLGCFHLVMSLLGAMGHIMAGSGIKEIFSIIYAEGSVDKILDGHSYARAVRAHSILQQALSLLIMEELKKENVEFQKILEEEEILSLDIDIDRIQNNKNFQKLCEIYELKLNEIEKRGKTCKLWILYYRMVSLLKNIIAAERMGDWKLHLQCIELTIPFFHATGHFNYAKSARLYLQDMKSLSETMDPEEYKKFTDYGYFTSRRSNAFYSGIFSDQTIEQTLMRAMGVEGGPFKRGATNSVVLKWIKGVLFTKDIIENLEEFCNIEFSKSHQHVDSRDARVAKDEKDVLALRQFLSDNNPFEDIEPLQNIVTGLVGTDDINCYNALTIGIEASKKITGINFAEIKLSKKDKVVSLLGVNSKLKIDEKYIPIDPLLLFQRICVMKKSDEEFESYMKYELAPYPLSLFDDVGMRKCTKSTLYSSFQALDITLNKNNCAYYIDGGMLLYKIKWPSDCKYQKVFEDYIFYLKRNFGNFISVVFDCYDSDNNKAAERCRRSMKVASKEFNFTKDSKLCVSQEKFLSNYKNKSRFIEYLKEELQKKDITCYQGDGEADELLVDVAIKENTDMQKVIVAEDIDVLVILTGRAKAEEEIYFLKLGKQNADAAVYSSKSLEMIYPNCSASILFAHCFTGCDSTSAFFNKGKKKFIDILEKRDDVREKAEIFYNRHATLQDVIDAGQYCTIVLYGVAKDTHVRKVKNLCDLTTYLEKMRYESFIKATTKKSAVKLSSLVPTVGALNEHLKRVYLQTQIWLGNKNINPLDWGWVNIDGVLNPIKNPNQPAPEELLKMIFCKCKKGCGAGCGCRKVGLFCNSTCACSGDNCLNAAPIIDQDEDEQENDDDDEAPQINKMQVEDESSEDSDS